jgi:hypothetical protein
MNPHYHYTPHHPLHTTWRSRRHRRRPPTPSSSATAAIVTITGLVVAWCRLPPHLHPHHCRPPPTQPHQRRHPRRLTSSSSPPAIPLPPPSPSRPLRPLDRPWRRASCVMDWHAASMPSPPVRRGKCRSRMRSPRRDTGPLRQCRRHSPAASGKPSFSRAAAASQATATAARRRCWSSLATRCRNDDAVTTTPDHHGHLRRPLAFGLLEGVV